MNLNEEGLAFYYLMGECFSQWSYIENQLLNLTCSCVSIPDRAALAVAFHSTESFRGRLAICNNLVRYRFGASSHVDRWVQLHVRIEKAASQRNKIAHALTRYYPTARIGRHWALVTSRQIDGHLVHVDGERAPQGSLFVRDLAGTFDEFWRVTGEIANVNCLFERGWEPFPTDRERASKLPLLRDIKHRLHFETGLFPLPATREPQRIRAEEKALP